MYICLVHKQFTLVQPLQKFFPAKNRQSVDTRFSFSQWVIGCVVVWKGSATWCGQHSLDRANGYRPGAYVTHGSRCILGSGSVGFHGALHVLHSQGHHWRGLLPGCPGCASRAIRCCSAGNFFKFFYLAFVNLFFRKRIRNNDLPLGIWFRLIMKETKIFLADHTQTNNHCYCGPQAQQAHQNILFC